MLTLECILTTKSISIGESRVSQPEPSSPLGAHEAVLLEPRAEAKPMCNNAKPMCNNINFTPVEGGRGPQTMKG